MIRQVTAVIVLLGAVLAGDATARVIHTERSLYQNILITREGDEVCMKFSLRVYQRRQSCIDLERPRRMVFTYTRMMLAGLLVAEASPKRVLIVGLGGGTLPTALAALLPDSHIDVVEIDPAVVRMAETFFGFQSTPRVTVSVQDARVFGRRAALDDRRYDLILLDAFTADYIPEHLMTVEYLDETRALLAPNGVLVANTFAVSDLYDYESVTYERVFGPFLNLRTWNSANRVIIASPAPLPNRHTLESRAAALAPSLKAYGVPITDYPGQMSRDRDWDPATRPLTDQYSPANLLRGDLR